MNRTCVSGECIEGNIYDYKPWIIDMEMDGEVKAVDINMSELLGNITEVPDVKEDQFITGIRCDENGYVISVFLFLDNEETAEIMLEALDRLSKSEGCEYGVDYVAYHVV